MRKNNLELKDNFSILADKLNLNEHEMSLLYENYIKQDEINIEYCLRSEGSINAISDFITDIENVYLSELDISEIYNFKDKNSSEWFFLDITKTNNIYNTILLLEEYYRNLDINKSQLMILRKEVNEFVMNRLKVLRDNTIPSDVVNHIIDNYTYEGTLFNLGFDKDINKLKLNEDTLRYDINT